MSSVSFLYIGAFSLLFPSTADSPQKLLAVAIKTPFKYAHFLPLLEFASNSVHSPKPSRVLLIPHNSSPTNPPKPLLFHQHSSTSSAPHLSKPCVSESSKSMPAATRSRQYMYAGIRNGQADSTFQPSSPSTNPKNASAAMTANGAGTIWTGKRKSEDGRNLSADSANWTLRPRGLDGQL